MRIASPGGIPASTTSHLTGGFYSELEFDLSPLPSEVLDDGVELGRACVARGHRGHHILELLWSGIAAYVFHNKKRFCFGCASMPDTAPAQAAATTVSLREGGHLHSTLRVLPRPDFAIADVPPAGDHQIPGLLQAYLALGARICSPPARDAAFGTIDYFVLLDVEDVEPAVVSKFTTG